MSYDMTVTPRVKQIAAEAADLLESEGWGQGHLQCEDGSYCLFGALIHSATNQTENFGAWGNEVDAAAWAAIPEGAVDPVAWNDDPERTAQEVIDALRAVAA